MTQSSAIQGTQIGVETTRGTEVDANRIIDAWTVKLPPGKADSRGNMPGGRKYESKGARSIDREWNEWGVESKHMDYNSIIYILSSVYGAITPTANGSSATAKNWSKTPAVASESDPKTYTIEQGNSSRARLVTYGLLNKFSYKVDRKEASCSASGFSTRITDGITMTSSPVRIADIPMSASHWTMYIDTTSGAMGTTPIDGFINFEYNFDGVFNPVWFVKRATPSISGHVDLAPKTGGKILFEANAGGMGYLDSFRDVDALYVRMEAQGLVIDNLQVVSLGTPSAGTFTLTYKGQTTSTIAYNAAASAVQSALEALSTIEVGEVAITGSAGGPYSVVFQAALAQDTTAMTGSGAGLTDGTFLITQAQSYDKFVHDMCIEISEPNDFEDSEGVFAVPWGFTVVEDSTWGKAQVLTATNLLTAL